MKEGDRVIFNYGKMGEGVIINIETPEDGHETATVVFKDVTCHVITDFLQLVEQ